MAEILSANATIFALSSGAPPAAIAVVRVSGSNAGAALAALAGRLPAPRHATYARLTEPGNGALLDRGLVLWLPGPATATGEDTAELHVHGGRAVVAAVERALAALPGLRRAQPGEFTRRAFANGRIDLAEAEGLADLLTAETELQRRTAMVMAAGGLSRSVELWRERLLGLSAALEAVLDFSDEHDVADLPSSFASDCVALASDLAAWLERPRAEPLRQGFRIVLAGPPNVGKSTLFNALTGSEAAITSARPGTTRDVIERSVAVDGVPLVFVDTAGLRSDGADEVERIGVDRALQAADDADLILWLGEEGAGASGAHVWEVEARADRADRLVKISAAHRVSAHTGEGLAGLRQAVVVLARAAMPKPGEPALNQRQHARLQECCDALVAAASESDPVLAAEGLRQSRAALDRLVGRAGTEDLLDTLFGRFCIGK